MAMTPYTGDTSIIADLATYWSERGLTGPQMQAKFDEGLTNFVAWFNAAHLAELGGSFPNRNLLHNWYLKNVINHRGITTKSGSDYGIDRWMMNDAAGSITVAGGAVTNVSLSSAWAGWFQAVEDFVQYKGKTVTFSVFIESLTSGTAYARIFDGAATFDSDVPLAVGLNTVTATISASADRLWCGIGTKLASPVSCCPSMCKLEPGRFSTLMNDPPADYGEELRKCQRFCVAYNQFAQFIGVDFQPNVIDFTIQTPCNMFKLPGILNPGNLSLISNKTVQTGFTYSVAASSGNNIRLRASKNAHGLTNAIIECSGPVLLTADL